MQGVKKVDGDSKNRPNEDDFCATVFVPTEQIQQRGFRG